MRKKNQLYEVEIKSLALIREGKKSFITYFRGGNKKTIVSNAMVLYPQFTKAEDKPVVNITPISYSEYQKRVDTNVVRQKQHVIYKRDFVMQPEDYKKEEGVEL